MKKSILLFFIFIGNLTYAQDFHVNLKATGLTCAMCSYSTQRSLERLDFVESITPDLEETSFLIDFKKDKFIDFDLIQEKVEDAGFFVGEIEVIFSDEITAENDKHSIHNGNLFHFFSDNDSKSKTFKLVDRNFIPRSKFDIISEKTDHACYMTGKKTSSCCTKHESTKSNKIFHLKSDI